MAGPMEFAVILCCLLSFSTIRGSSGFYFPDQVSAKAKADSNAWSDGYGNSQANANSEALATGGNNGGSGYSEFYEPPIHDYQGYQGYGGRYPPQGFTPVYDGPHQQVYDPRPPYSPSPVGGQWQSNSNANANSQNFGNTGSSISNAIANSNSLGPNGEASAAAAAAAAGTSFVNGVPIVSAAASAAAASSHGGSSSVSSANSDRGPRYPSGFQYQRPQYQGSYERPPNVYNQYGHQPINPWQYRSGGDDIADGVVVEADSSSRRSSQTNESSKVVFKD
ncbi:uncharacterized protein LOC106641823 [Copidosoma floridanum]|uniref:uncharacterized protein LOC106641823 n=1 Tax=Copidosoma floridanum TaxID=29053 RepID=UPI0006C944B1|nr:uncharacterized protein LOC106641823 [Copidosoma floridanum]